MAAAAPDHDALIELLTAVRDKNQQQLDALEKFGNITTGQLQSASRRDLWKMIKSLRSFHADCEIFPNHIRTRIMEQNNT